MRSSEAVLGDRTSAHQVGDDAERIVVRQLGVAGPHASLRGRARRGGRPESGPRTPAGSTSRGRRTSWSKRSSARLQCASAWWCAAPGRDIVVSTPGIRICPVMPPRKTLDLAVELVERRHALGGGGHGQHGSTGALVSSRRASAKMRELQRGARSSGVHGQLGGCPRTIWGRASDGLRSFAVWSRDASAPADEAVDHPRVRQRRPGEGLPAHRLGAAHRQDAAVAGLIDAPSLARAEAALGHDAESGPGDSPIPGRTESKHRDPRTHPTRTSPASGPSHHPDRRRQAHLPRPRPPRARSARRRRCRRRSDPQGEGLQQARRGGRGGSCSARRGQSRSSNPSSSSRLPSDSAPSRSPRRRRRSRRTRRSGVSSGITSRAWSSAAR